MFYFEGSACVHCGVELKETDDIVACPVCGAPHHRSCYQEANGCANESLHADGYSWKRDSSASEQNDGSGKASGKIFCGVCGAENSNGRLYCFNCGKPLFDDEAGTGAAGARGYDFFETESIDEIPMSDVKRYLGNSAFMYAPVFYQLHKLKKKISFNFIALLFPTLWFLNRKMYGRGLLIMLYNLVSYSFVLFNYDIYTEVYNASMNLDSAALEATFAKYPLVCGILILSGLLSYVIAILSALLGNKAFMDRSLRRIRKLRRKHSDDEKYHAELEKNGRSNFGVVLVLMLLYLIAHLALGRFGFTG